MNITKTHSLLQAASNLGITGLLLLSFQGLGPLAPIRAQPSASVSPGLRGGPAPRPAEPLLETARQLVTDLQDNAHINQYGSHPTFLRWAHPTREARTVCGSFVTRLLEHTYGWKEADIRRWLGAEGTDAVEWHDAIARSNGFQRLNTIVEISPGDILAIKYSDGSKDTGHVMVVNGEPKPMEPTAPVETGTRQYRVEVIDSSATGHGPTDTRHCPEGGFTGGIGRGTIRLYANPDGTIAGYAWSETPQSKFYQTPKRDLVAGRLTRLD